MFYKCFTVNLASRAVVASVLLIATGFPARSAEWEPPPPMPDEFDWVQFTSGEWLKGEIKVMYEDSLEFDSDELDLLTLDFADIQELRSAQVLNVRMQDGETATGKVLLENDSIKVLGDSPQQFDRAAPASATSSSTAPGPTGAFMQALPIRRRASSRWRPGKAATKTPGP